MKGVRTESLGFLAASWSASSLGAFALLVALGAASASAAAKPPALRLIYERGRGVTTASCPDEQALRESVAARLGYDPFHERGDGAVRAALAGGPQGLRAIVELRDRGGRVTGSRQLTTASSDCRELFAAMALAICIAVDPFVLSRAPAAPPAPQPPPAPAPCPDCPACPPPPVSPLRFRAGVGVQLDVGALPTLGSLGVVAQAELRYRAFALALEGRIEPSLGSASAAASMSMSAGVSASLLLALVVPCARYRFVGFCALLGLGALQGRGVGLAIANQATTFYAAAGARLSFEVPLHRRLALELHLDGLAPLTRTSLLVDGAAAWTTPSFGGGLGANLQVPFS